MSFFTPLTSDSIDNLLVTEFVRAYTNAAPGAPIPATNTGATLGSAFRAVRILAMQLQNNQTAIESTARLNTSQNGDVDSFCAPFNVPRNQASPSSGTVTFSCTSPPPQQIIIPVGLIVQTAGGIQFTVIADPTNQPGYSATAGGYVIAAGANPAQVNATVQCSTAGSIGNVPIGAINTLVSAGGPMPAVSAVTNAAAFTNGADQEQDPPYKSRFTLEVSGQKSGTNNAIAAAILGVQSNITYSIGDLLSSSGQLQVAPQTTTSGAVAIPAVNSSANFTLVGSNVFPFGAFVIVSDGSQAFYGQVTSLTDATHVAITNLKTLVAGSGIIASGATVLFAGSLAYFTAVVNVIGQSTAPSQALLNSVSTAIGSVVAAGTSFWVIAPTLVTVTPAATIHVPSSVDVNAAQASLGTAFSTYVNNIGLDPAGNSTTCALGKIYSILYATLATMNGVTAANANVESLTLNGGTADVTAGFASQLVAGTPNFTVVSP